jgi:hypothetical protein
LQLAKNFFRLLVASAPSETEGEPLIEPEKRIETPLASTENMGSALEMVASSSELPVIGASML